MFGAGRQYAGLEISGTAGETRQEDLDVEAVAQYLMYAKTFQLLIAEENVFVSAVMDVRHIWPPEHGIGRYEIWVNGIYPLRAAQT
ncbi:hypothetical protein ACFSZS_12520 [Seohaeicola zhoushanensis]